MNYRSVAALNQLVVKWQCRLPRDLDVIVGVPRSGMLVANLLALHLNLPMTDVDGLLDSRLITFSGRSKKIDLHARCRVLVVDDSISTGRQMLQVQQRVAEANLGHDVRYGAAYVRPGAESSIDFCGEHLPDPQLFEWNLMHHPVLLGSCLDIDGVLCEDPTQEADDDGQRYRRFLETAAPMVLPTMPIGWLVTARLERYRKATERWLAKHGVSYRELVMWNLPDRNARERSESHGEYKASVYRATNADLFIESSVTQALEIADLSGKGVFCMATSELIRPTRQWSLPTSDVSRATTASNPAIATSGSWTSQLQVAVTEFLRIVPPGATAIVMDDWDWPMGRTFANRRVIHFVERDDQYVGPPSDDAEAVAELERLRASGATYAMLASPSFWWRDSYPRFFAYLRERYLCAFEHPQMVVYDLSAMRVPPETRSSDSSYA